MEKDLKNVGETVEVKTAKVYIVTDECSALTLRKDKSDESDILKFMLPGTEVEILKSEKEWTKVKVIKDKTGTLTGYAKSAYLKEK